MSVIYEAMISPVLFILFLGAGFLYRRRIMKSAYEPKGRDNLPAYDFFLDLFLGHQKAINRRFMLCLLLFLVINAIYTIWRAQSTYQQELDFYSNADWFDGNAEEKAKDGLWLEISVPIFMEGVALLLFIWFVISTYLASRSIKKRLKTFEHLDIAQSDYISNRGNQMKSGSFFGDPIIGNHYLFVPAMGVIIPYNDISSIDKSYGSIWERCNTTDMVSIYSSQGGSYLRFDLGLSNSHKKMEDFCTALKKKGVNI